jgi:hypothetical protein
MEPPKKNGPDKPGRKHFRKALPSRDIRLQQAMGQIALTQGLTVSGKESASDGCLRIQR